MRNVIKKPWLPPSEAFCNECQSYLAITLVVAKPTATAKKEKSVSAISVSANQPSSANPTSPPSTSPTSSANPNPSANSNPSPSKISSSTDPPNQSATKMEHETVFLCPECAVQSSAPLQVRICAKAHRSAQLREWISKTKEIMMRIRASNIRFAT
mmetsp:Transcript_33830/g.62815  ORF Transcript_33830/g.62815 Transcript_33830/m.62815 type:complete len:156 (-) Transcript_33830:119-586(-)